MGFRLPPALAGNDNEVSFDESGARKLFQLAGGVAVGAATVTAGLLAFNRVRDAAGQQQNISDLY